MEYNRARQAYSALQQERLTTPCTVPEALNTRLPKGTNLSSDVKRIPEIDAIFEHTCGESLVSFKGDSSDEGSAKPLNVGVILSGGQAAGGHNVIAGIYDGLHRRHPDSVVYGFLDGPHGLFSGIYVKITAEMMDGFRNTGGFDMLGSGRHKIESAEQFEASRKVAEALDLDGIVVIGGDDSNTNAALLAEFFKSKNVKTCVVGCPKTIDGDLKVAPHIPVSFGFDTACRTYAELVGSLTVDVRSTQKYYHFARLMGRSASHIALEVALLSRPNMCLLGEEIKENNKSLKDITMEMANMIIDRAAAGKNYGVVLLPEGLIEFIPEIKVLISQINEILAKGVPATDAEVAPLLTDEARAVFNYLPSFIRQQLMLDRDPHGNVQVAKIETEKLLSATVGIELSKARAEGRYNGVFTPQYHFFGYEGRAGLPSVFDSKYCYALGATASALLGEGRTGLIASVKNLQSPYPKWECGGVPIVSLCHIERRSGKNVPVIRKALVELEGPLSQPFQAWTAIRETLKLSDSYKVQQPIQYDENAVGYDDVPETLRLELGGAPEPLPETDGEKKMKVFWPRAQDEFIHYGKMPRSTAEKWRSAQPYRVPRAIHRLSLASIHLREGAPTQCSSLRDEGFMKRFYPETYGSPLLFFDAASEGTQSAGKLGVVICGRQSPGGHDIVHGVTSFASRNGWEVLGFIGGTEGFFAKQYISLTEELTQAFARTGGMALLGRTQEKIRGREEDMKKVCEELNLNGLILVGGSRTISACVEIAEYFTKNDVKTSLVTVPMSISGAIKGPLVEESVGFDSNCKAVARLVGNFAIDGASARKYWYFLRTMESNTATTSHVTLEVALETHPNICLLNEIIEHQRLTLTDVVNKLCDIISARADNACNFGTLVLPDNLLESMSEFSILIDELQKINLPDTAENVIPQLSSYSGALLSSLPDYIAKDFLSHKQSDSSIALAQVQTEQLLSDLVAAELKRRKAKGTYKGSFSSVCQFLGYQARCSVPSNFDSNLGFAFGVASCNLAIAGKNGYMVSAFGLKKDPEDWTLIGVPVTAVVETDEKKRVNMPRRKVDLRGSSYQLWANIEKKAAMTDIYENPGPIQFLGATCDCVGQRLMASVNEDNYVDQVCDLATKLKKIGSACRPGCSAQSLRIANRTLQNLLDTIDDLSAESDAHKPVTGDQESMQVQSQFGRLAPTKTVEF